MKNVSIPSLLSLAILAGLCSCGGSQGVLPDPDATVAGQLAAREEVLRLIPAEAVEAARTGLHVAYQHTSHGTHVSYGLFGLPGYRPGDATRFAITNGAEPAVAGSLDFHDYYSDGDPSGLGGNWVPDLSLGVDALTDGQPAFVHATRTYLDAAGNQDINVVMWSWCSITGHNVQYYLDGMQTLIGEYGPGGSRLGAGPGDRTVPVAFIFMTGHAERDSNAGAGHPAEQAALITEFCEENGYWCLDYFSIDTHAMDGTEHADAGDNGDWDGGNFCVDWQDAHEPDDGWYWNRTQPAPAGAVAPGMHNEDPLNHLTANRKAYAMWYILARVAGWDGRL